MLVRDERGGGRIQMKPDFLLHLDHRVVAILDAKWKVHGASGFDLAEDDLYQLLAYGHTYGCRNLALVYPRQAATDGMMKPDLRFHPHDDSALRLRVLIVDLEAAAGSARRIVEEALAAVAS
jgi:5-methylcytosine-specific restriction enzyme subunit McrC